jgi:hypothetical protein
MVSDSSLLFKIVKSEIGTYVAMNTVAMYV